MTTPSPPNLIIPRLGPQCLSCKKRRTKCDSNLPGCKRCARDGVECPGYVKKLKWSYYRGGKGAKGRREGREDENAGERLSATKRSEVQSKVYGDGDESEYSSAPETTQQTTPLTFPESLEDREYRLILNASDWYNEYMLPQLMPAQLPFRRANHKAASWDAAPSIIRNLMLLLVKTQQIKRSGNDIGSQSELCLYREQSLLDLKTSLVEAAREPFGIVLSGIITLMGVDLQSPALGEWNWIYHFNAAYRIIQLRGGFSKCFFSLPHSQGLLAKYMMLDIFSTSTCCTEQLSVERVRSQSKYIPIILLREQAMLENGQLCPQQLLQAIIRTNTLRCESQTGFTSRPSEDTFTYQDVLSTINDFDPTSWTERVCRYGLTQPLRPGHQPIQETVDAWSALGTCFKKAALLYTTLSLHAPTDPEGILRVVAIQNDLEAHLLHLFNIASAEADAAIETQLWKFCLWPAAISAYVNVCWCCGNDQEVEVQICRLNAAAVMLKNDALARCAEFIRKVAVRRREFMGANWRWSDGFASRSCGFVAC